MVAGWWGRGADKGLVKELRASPTAAPAPQRTPTISWVEETPYTRVLTASLSLKKSPSARGRQSSHYPPPHRGLAQ